MNEGQGRRLDRRSAVISRILASLRLPDIAGVSPSDEPVRGDSTGREIHLSPELQRMTSMPQLLASGAPAKNTKRRQLNGNTTGLKKETDFDFQKS